MLDELGVLRTSALVATHAANLFLCAGLPSVANGAPKDHGVHPRRGQLRRLWRACIRWLVSSAQETGWRD